MRTSKNNNNDGIRKQASRHNNINHLQTIDQKKKKFEDAVATTRKGEYVHESGITLPLPGAPTEPGEVPTILTWYEHQRKRARAAKDPPFRYLKRALHEEDQ